eukprot:1984706-Amphidinium_carterae.2
MRTRMASAAELGAEKPEKGLVVPYLSLTSRQELEQVRRSVSDKSEQLKYLVKAGEVPSVCAFPDEEACSNFCRLCHSRRANLASATYTAWYIPLIPPSVASLGG